MAELSKCCSAFKCCKYCRDLKNVANVAVLKENVAKTLQKTKNVAEF